MRHALVVRVVARSRAAEAEGRGGVAVADTGNNRVQVIRPDGTISAWGIAGRSAGYVTRPRGVAFAPDGGIAIADTFGVRAGKRICSLNGARIGARSCGDDQALSRAGRLPIIV